MTDRRFAMCACVVVLGGVLAACTAKDRYYSVRSENLRECERRLTEVDRERCRARLAPAAYDEYERLRRTIPGGEETHPEQRKVKGGRTASEH